MSSLISGPYLRKTDNRRFLIITKEDGTKTTKSYAKHLLEQKIGRELVNNETADHIDGNSLNDIPDNLQILSREENARKGASTGVTMIKLNCSECNKEIILEKRNKRRLNTFCNRHCAGKFNQRLRTV